MYKYIISLTNLSIRFTLTCLLFLSISACSSKSSPVVYYNSFDFSQVKSYSFYMNGSAFFDSQSLDYAQRNRVELAIENTLNSQGLSYSEFNQANILVTYYFVNKSARNYQKYNKTVRFCSRCLKANSWIKNDIDWNVYPGGLIIDLVNPKNNRSVWRSIYPLDYDVEDNSQELNDKIIEAVNTMLSHYPKKSPTK